MPLSRCVALTAITCACAAHTLLVAQNAPRKYKPGDMVEFSATEVYKIIKCDGDGDFDDCEVQAYRDNKPSTSGTFRMTNRNLRAGEQRLHEEKQRKGLVPAPSRTTTGDTTTAPRPAPPAPAQPSKAAPAITAKPAAGPIAGLDGKWKVGDRLEVNSRAFWYPAQIVAVSGGKYKVHYDGYPASDDELVDPSRMRPIGGFQVAEACVYEPPGPAVSASNSFSETLAKRRIFDEYGMKANGTLSAPLKVGVTFLAFQMGSPYRNTVANVPGVGAQRRHAGAAPGATIYTFKSKHMVCEQYRDGVTRRLVEGSYACFVREGSWTCPSEPDTKITQLEKD